MQRTKRRSPSDQITLDDEFRPIVCPNCGTDRRGPYCHQCGQRFLKDRLTAKELWVIFANRFLDWEEGAWRTFVKMVTAPGLVVRHYLGGKRKTYLNPFSYLLFCVALYMLGQFLMRQSSTETGFRVLQGVQEWGMVLNNTEDQFTLITYGTILAVVLLAVAIRLVFDGRFLNSVEAVVTTIYTSGNTFLLALIISAINCAFAGGQLSLSGLAGTFALLFPINLAYVGHGLFERLSMALYLAVAPMLAVIFGLSAWTFIGGFLRILSITFYKGGLIIGAIGLALLTILVTVFYLLAREI